MSAIAPSIGGFFTSLVKPMLSTLIDRIAQPHLSLSDQQHNVKLVDNFLPAVFKNRPYAKTNKFDELRHKASGKFYTSMYDQLEAAKKKLTKYHQNGHNSSFDHKISPL